MGDYYIETENADIKQNNIEYFFQQFTYKQNRVNPHIHQAVEILHVAQGQFKVCVDGTEYILNKNDTVLIRSNAIHWVNCLLENKSSYYVLKFNPLFLLNFALQGQSSSYLLAFALQNREMKTVWRNHEDTEITNAVLQLFNEAKDNNYGADIAIKICFANIILYMLRSIKATGKLKDFGSAALVRRIYDAIVFINTHYAEDITAEDCSKQVFLSYSYFSRSFKRITGKTFCEYLTATRINQAEKAIIATQKPISQISVECGFNNFSHFSAIYKKVKGVSPTAARENALKMATDNSTN